jgi:methylmalonyl-CoA/ethylmalonyl-CoA epimerase
MVQAIKPVFNAKFEQVCMVVKNVDSSIENMWNKFGIGPWNISIVKADTITNVTYLGKPGSFGFKVALTQVRGFELELIEPTEGKSAYLDFLKEHGEGVHHLGCPPLDSLETLNKTVKELEKAGFPCIMSGRCQPGNFAYIDTTKVLNTNMEIYWPDPNGYRPPFDYTYPKK